MKAEEAYKELERSIYVALETYSNVHRGSGHYSLVSTHLYEQARDIVLKYLELDPGRYIVLFCSPRGEVILKALQGTKSHKSVSSLEFGLPLGVRAIAVKRKDLPDGIPFQSGGGTTVLVSRKSVIWAGIPERFEPGTPAIINIIAFARSLQLIMKFGRDIFMSRPLNNMAAEEILYHDGLEKISGKELLDKLAESMIGRSIPVPTTEGNRNFINLDNSASTSAFEPVWNTVIQTIRQSPGVQQEIIREARSICADTLGAPMDSYDIIFTSNTTEAINLVAESFSRNSGQPTEPVVVSSLLEHSSNDLPWRKAQKDTLIRLGIDDEGFLDMSGLETILRDYNHLSLHGNKRIELVSVSGASNVLGVYNDLPELSRIVHQYGARLLVDGAQLVAHRKSDIERSGIDYFAFSAHKVYAPFGCGVLIVKKGILNFSAGELDDIRLAGEENVAGIAALGKSLALMQRVGMDIVREKEQELTKRVLKGMAGIKGLRIYGITDPDSHGFTSKGGVFVFSLKGVMPDRLARELAEQHGIGVRYGCHCAHILIKHLLNVPPSLERFQGILLTLMPWIRLPGVTRISIGIGNSGEDIDRFIQALKRIAARQKYSRPPIKQEINEFISASARKVYPGS